MAVIKLEDFTIFDGDLSEERWKKLSIHECDDENVKNRFLRKMVEVNTKNKEQLRDLLGGKKIYTTIEEIRASVDFLRIKEIMYNEWTMGDVKYEVGSRKWYLENNPLKMALDELYRFATIMNVCTERGASEKQIIEVLKGEYFYNENVNKIRNLPKLTRLFNIIYEGVLERWQLKNCYDGMVAKIMDELGRKPKKYIMELSTDAIDILTCSVTNNFSSCFNICNGGCNMASTNYLALDRTTAILKIYEDNDKNRECMKCGALDFNNSIARVFVSFDVDDRKRMVIGRLYPDNKILDYDSLKTILFPLLKCEDISKGEWVEDMIINYGNNYVGYADYNESWNVGYMATFNCKRISVGDMGMVFYNYMTDSFDTSTKYLLFSSSMWELTETSRWQLARDTAIKSYNRDKEECETTINIVDYTSTSIVDAFNSIVSVDFDPFDLH